MTISARRDLRRDQVRHGCDDLGDGVLLPIGKSVPNGVPQTDGRDATPAHVEGATASGSPASRSQIDSARVTMA